MSFHEDTKDLILSAIDKEYENACQEHGKRYHSLHEGWAVLKEEVEEAKWHFTDIKYQLKFLWRDVKLDDKSKCLIYASNIQGMALDAMMELAQVYACCMKLQNTLQGGENG